MTILDTRLRATAEVLIERFGKAMTLRQEASGTYNTSAGTAAETPTDYAIKAVFSAPSRALFEAGLAAAGDMSALVAAKALEAVPQPGNALLVDGATWRVLAVNATYSGEQVAVYELLARS